MHSKTPSYLQSTIDMIRCAFGADHVFSDREVAVLIDVMGEHGMSDRNIAAVVAVVKGRPAGDYADYLQFVSWSSQARRVHSVLKREIMDRLQQCGFTEWEQED